MLDPEFEKRIKVMDTPDFAEWELSKREKIPEGENKKTKPNEASKNNGPKTSHPNGAFELEDILLRQEERGLI